MAPSLSFYFSIVSMFWFTFAIVSIIIIIIIMLWPPHLFSASNAPGTYIIMIQYKISVLKILIRLKGRKSHAVHDIVLYRN